MVLLGANPNVCVFKKLLGSNDSSNLDTPWPNDEPTLSGLGIIVVSSLSVDPAPNCISNCLLDLNLDTNLLLTFLVLNK